MTLERVVSRRTALKALGTTAGGLAFLPWISEEGAAAFDAVRATKAAPALKVLTAAQYTTTEALVEAIIPTDERSPGAKEARVADFIDLVLSEANADPKKEWLDGLAALDAESVTRFQAPFAKLQAAQQETLLTDISRYEMKEPKKETPEETLRAMGAAATHEPPKEKPVEDIFRGMDHPDPEGPQTPLEKFFAVTKRATVQGYYTSEIGIHQELKYKGNQMLAEFVGCLTQDGKDCPHCGQKAEA